MFFKEVSQQSNIYLIKIFFPLAWRTVPYCLSCHQHSNLQWCCMKTILKRWNGVSDAHEISVCVLTRTSVETVCSFSSPTWQFKPSSFLHHLLICILRQCLCVRGWVFVVSGNTGTRGETNSVTCHWNIWLVNWMCVTVCVKEREKGMFIWASAGILGQLCCRCGCYAYMQS